LRNCWNMSSFLFSKNIIVDTLYFKKKSIRCVC